MRCNHQGQKQTDDVEWEVDSEKMTWHHHSGWMGHDRWPEHLQRKRRIIFRRFLLFGLLFFVIVTSGLGVLIYLFLLRLFAGGEAPPVPLPPRLPLVLVALIILVGVSAFVWLFRQFGSPLAVILAAVDAVAEGDLTIRVPENGPREFIRLAVSFNRMVRELQRADQQRRNLTADVAHELRTPLHIIQGNLEGILDGVYQPDEAHIQATLDETRLLARLVDDLQILSRAEAGQLSLSKEWVAVDELLEDAATSFESRAETLGINLKVKLDSPVQDLKLYADAGRLDQVLGNLISNALRYTPREGEIELRAGATPEKVTVWVSDSGEGIAAQDLPYIFDRFWRSDRSRSHSAGATSGLGLAISKQLVEAQGGKIEVQSQPGKGTVYKIELPRQKVDSRGDESTAG